jgi:hypothetical protein
MQLSKYLCSYHACTPPLGSSPCLNGGVVPFFLPVAVASGYFGNADYHQFHSGVLGLHVVVFWFCLACWLWLFKVFLLGRSSVVC